MGRANVNFLRFAMQNRLDLVPRGLKLYTLLKNRWDYEHGQKSVHFASDESHESEGEERPASPRFNEGVEFAIEKLPDQIGNRQAPRLAGAIFDTGTTDGKVS